MLQVLTAGRLQLLKYGRWAVLLALFSIPINKPATSIFLFLALLCSLIGAQPVQRWKAPLREPIVLGMLAWFAVLLLSALHAADNPQRWADLGVYKALLYPLLIASLLNDQNWRERGLFAYGAAALLVLLLSWSQLFGLLPAPDITATFEAYRYTVFHEYSQQGLQMLILASLCAAFAPRLTHPRWRNALWLVAALAVADVLFLLQSRTAYLAILCLLLYWSWRLTAQQHGKTSKLLLALLVAVTLSVSLTLAPRMQARMEAAQQDISQYLAHHEASSLGIRLELWRRTLPIIAAAPWFGHGLGEWLTQYRAQTSTLNDFDAFRMKHPHNDALLILAEEGVAGFLFWVTLLVLLARRLRTLQPVQRDFFASLLLIFLAAGTANCLLVDFVNRHVFILLLACFPILLVPKNKAPGVKPTLS